MAGATDSRVVLDASATLSFAFEDERDELALAMASAIVYRGALVPALWRLELRNALLSAERRRRLKSEEVDRILADIGRLGIEVAEDSLSGAREPELALAREHGLSLYDAAYLQLAVSLQLPLMTRDSDLAKAAQSLKLLWKPTARGKSSRTVPRR